MWNVFYKPDEQNEARFNSAMARKGGMKFNVFDKPDEQNEARFNSAMARKGGMKFNLWHGCHKKSEGCQHCYVFRRDAEFEKDSNVVLKTSTFNLPIRRDRQGNWKVPSGTLMWPCSPGFLCGCRNYQGCVKILTHP